MLRLLALALAILSAAAWAQPQGGALKRIKESGTINLGYRDPNTIRKEDFANREADCSMVFRLNFQALCRVSGTEEPGEIGEHPERKTPSRAAKSGRCND